MIVSSLGSPIARSLSNDSIRSDKPDTSINTDGSSHTIIEMLNEHIPAEQRSELSSEDLRFALMSVDDALNEIITERQRSEGIETDAFVETFVQLLKGETGSAESSEIAVEIFGSPDLENSKDSPDSFVHRGQMILEYLGEQLGKLARNEFEGNLGRWASNLTISTVRTGLVTGTLTVIRQLTGFLAEKTLQTNAASPLTRNVMGTVAQSVGPILNVLGAIRDECSGTANLQTRMARLLTLTLSVLAFAAAATVPAALPALASFGSQMLFYTLAQDVVSLFCPTGDNAKVNPGGTAVAGVLNGVLQFLSFTAMNYIAPHSGPGYVMAQGNKPATDDTEGLAFQLSAWVAQQANVTLEADPSARTAQILESLKPRLTHDAWRGVFNGAADVAGQVVLGEAMHAFQANPSENGFRVNPLTVQIPTGEQVANQFLSTDAIRTSIGQIIMGVVLAGSRYFSNLPISKEMADHIVNTIVAGVVFAVRPGTAYINARNPQTV